MQETSATESCRVRGLYTGAVLRLQDERQKMKEKKIRINENHKSGGLRQRKMKKDFGCFMVLSPGKVSLY